MKVLILAPQKKIRQENGPAAVALNVCNELKRKGFNVEGCFIGRKDLLRLITVIFKISKYDIINVHSGNTVAYFLAFMPQAIKKKMIVTIHGYPEYEKDMHGISLKVHSFFTDLTLKKYQNISFVSNYLYNILKSKINANAVVYITPNGINNNIMNIPQYVTKNKNSLIFVGGTRYFKGIDILMRALLKSNQSFNVKIYGNPGNLHHNYLMYAQQYVTKGHIEFMGNQPLNKIYEALNKSLICVLPSRFDTFNIVLLEALFFKNIVFCSTSVGANYLIQNTKNGFIFDTENDLVELLNKIDVIDSFNISKQGNITALKCLWKYQIDNYISAFVSISKKKVAF